MRLRALSRGDIFVFEESLEDRYVYTGPYFEDEEKGVVFPLREDGTRDNRKRRIVSLENVVLQVDL